MEKEIKTRKERAKKVDIKISPTDYEKLEIYGDFVNTTPVKIINSLIKQYLDSEEVRKVLEENEDLIKMEQDLKKKEKETAELREKIKERKNQKK